jgi:hypothetical protein
MKETKKQFLKKGDKSRKVYDPKEAIKNQRSKSK